MTWNEALEPYRAGTPALFDSSFMTRWGRTTWQPADDDKAGAAKLHIQLVSRITTQRLGYLEGDEKTALTSVYSLFEKAREIATAHPQARHLETLTFHVLNEHVRPFTAKWHGQSERGMLTALDATDEFRADLNALRPVLQRFDSLLLYLRDGSVPADRSAAIPAGAPQGQIPIADEMNRKLRAGIRTNFSGFRNAGFADAINRQEQAAIRRRREHYFGPQNESTVETAALAISGGGIRSATFALGVLVSLAQRGLLPQFDYLSTVSGGGYLGAFISVFLQSPSRRVGLSAHQVPFKREEGEAEALRHIRHHSKYLAVGSTWERLKMMAAQMFGMALNAIALLWMLVIVVVVESYIREASPTTFARALPWFLYGLLVFSALSLIALRIGGSLRRYADAFVTVPAVLLAMLLCWKGLGLLHLWYNASSPSPSWPILTDKKAWVAIAGGIPVIAPLLASFFPRLLKWFGAAIPILTAISAPLFLVGVYLVLYAHVDWLTVAVEPWGFRMARWIPFAIVGFFLYVFVFDINATSPHRHYRRKLAQAFVIRPKKDSETEFDEDVPVRLTDLAAGTKAPYHLINCALNVPSSGDIAIQGRLTDFFLFSPAYSGSPLTGYWPTSDWENRDSRLDVGTAMAISGAAAAPQMGLGTIKRISFWLALLNVRLGYWAHKPKNPHDPAIDPRPDKDPQERVPRVKSLFPPGIRHLVKEMSGFMDEKGPWINLSDGGHIENLGVYELLRRRCKYIVAIDGEEDAKMTFQGLTTLQRLAAIDLGVKIEIDLDDLRLTAGGISRSHFRFCRIRYPQGVRGSADEFGYLLYVKLSLTGNEGEFIRRFRLDEPAFPHHSTADQFFSEAQFEAYRSLGEHVGDKLFLRAIVGELAGSEQICLGRWFQALGCALLEPTTSTRR